MTPAAQHLLAAFTSLEDGPGRSDLTPEQTAGFLLWIFKSVQEAMNTITWYQHTFPHPERVDRDRLVYRILADTLSP